MKFLAPVIFLFLMSSCQEKEDVVSNRVDQALEEESDDLEKDTSSDKDESAVSSDFYPMTGERPDSLCGEEGFRYLWEGYFLGECGTCHHSDNPYEVTEFAIRGDFEGSFEVMADSVSMTELIKAVEENPLCISCNLTEDDPLLADIKEYSSSPDECQ